MTLSYDPDHVENQIAAITRALNDRLEQPIPEDLAQPQVGDVTGDLKALTDKVNAMLEMKRRELQIARVEVNTGDGGLADFLDDMRTEQERQAHIQGGKGHLVTTGPLGVLMTDTDTQNEYPLPDDTTLITWIKLTTDVTTPESGLPFADGNPVNNKDGDNPDETVTVRVYLPQIGGGTVYLESGDVVPVQTDSNGDAISQQVGPATLPAANIAIGGCIVWADVDASGLPQNIPTGWAWCNGENGTIDMRGKFPVGYDPDDTDYDDATSTGGSATMTDSDHTVAAHDHTGTSGTESTHTHTFTTTAGAGWDVIGTSGADHVLLLANHTHTGTTDAGDSHSHTIIEQGAVTLTHSTQDNRPPWRVVVWIQRVS